MDNTKQFRHHADVGSVWPGKADAADSTVLLEIAAAWIGCAEEAEGKVDLPEE